MRAHVEVDQLEIVSGPGTTKLFEVALVLSDRTGAYLTPTTTNPDSRKITFTCTTAASATPFQCVITLEMMSQAASMSGDPGAFYFTGTYNNKNVSGTYSPISQKGDFSEM